MGEKPNKPFLSYEDQLKKLSNDYGLIINDFNMGIEVLKSVSYYDLINGYKECFMIDDKFKKDVDLLTIFQFSIFDKNFQNILFKYSVYVENTFKTRLSHIISKNFGVKEDEYLNITKYSFPRTKNRRDKLVETIEEVKNTIHERTENPTKHYLKNHNHIPPWILFKNINFNLSIDLYTFLKRTEKKEIIDGYFSRDNDFNKKAELLKSMITIVRKFRNKIAHNYKIIEYRTKESLNQNNVMSISNYNMLKNKDTQGKFKGRNDLFAMILSMTNLIGNKFLIANMLSELLFLLEADDNISKQYIEATNLPEDIISRLNKLFEKIKDEI